MSNSPRRRSASPLQPERRTTRTAPALPRRRWALWVAVAAVVLVATGLIAITSTSGDDDEAAETTTAVVPASSAPASTAPGATAGAGSPPTAVAPAETQPVTVTGTALSPLPVEGEDLSTGQMAPRIDGFSFDGTPLSVTPGAGHPMLVVFLAHWCPHCNAEVPRLAEWKQSGGVPDDLEVIGVSIAANSSRDNYPPSEWVTERGWDWPIIADSDDQQAAVAYGVSGLPFMAILAPDGTVLARHRGELGSAGEIDEFVRTALG